MPRLLTKSIRRGFGLKNLADYIESRQSMFGVTNLSIKTVIDIGANKGRLTKQYRKQFPDAQILSVEPIPALSQKIEQWADTQGGRVKVFNVALSSEPSESTFYISRDSSIWSTLIPPTDKTADAFEAVTVKVDTLDNMVKDLDIQDDVLIKIDTEGFDLEVIRGGKETLQRTAALIVETTFHPTGYGDSAPIFEEINKELFDLGFCYRGNTRCCWKNGVCMGADALFVKRTEAHRLAA